MTNKLATVNGISIDVQEAIRRAIMHNGDILHKAVDELLIRQYAEKKNITNSDEELQVAADEMRYQRGLESVEKLTQWIENNHLTILSLQNGIDVQLLRNKSRSSIPDSEIEVYFAEHKLLFDQVELYSIRLNSKEQAEELYAQITEEGENFHVLAMKYSQDEQTKLKAGYVGKVSRSEVTAEIEATVFHAQPGEIVGPIKTEKGYNLFKVNAVYPANLEAERENIRFQLFQNLITQLRAEAKISYPLLEQE